MLKMEAYARKISHEMGYGGELNEAVLEEANRVLAANGLQRHVMRLDDFCVDVDINDLLIQETK